MKLQKRVNRRVGDKEYVKWYVNIPSDMVKEFGWKEGQELQPEKNSKKLVLTPKKEHPKLDMS